MDEEDPVCIGIEREKERENKGEHSQEFRWKRGNVTEPFSMSACSRHQAGGAVGERDQSKCPCSGMSPQAVSFNNPGLPCVELRCPTKTLGWP